MSAAPGRSQASSHRSAQGEGTLMSAAPVASLGVTFDNGVLHLELRRADKGNALSAELVVALTAAVQQAYAAAPRLLLISAAGKHFCTGFDLSALDQESDDSLLARFTRVELMLQAIHAAPFPTLALGHGRVMGAGADLFCACSERWIVGDASFAFPGAAFGLVLGTTRLAAIAGPERAREWVESGALIDASNALADRLATRQLAQHEREAALAHRIERAQRLDAATAGGVHRAIDGVRRSRGDAGDAEDLARLVQSAARPGLKGRISAYRASQLRR
jgi:enoyl-CoA hydratase